MMNLRELWKKYDSYSQFNVSVLPEEIRAQGVQLVYPAGSVIISLGDFPDYVYFIQSGSAIGTRAVSYTHLTLPTTSRV